MVIEIMMPALSPTMTKGNLVKWHKKEGDIVNSGDILADIETDKAVMELESSDDGILGKICLENGYADVGNLIAFLLEDDETLEDIEGLNKESNLDLPIEKISPNDKKIEKERNTTEEKNNNNPTRIFASPLAKRIAKNNDIELSRILGSGPRGRIVKNDVERLIGEKSNILIQEDRKILIDDNHTKLIEESGKCLITKTENIMIEGTHRLLLEKIELDGMRKSIAQKMTESKQEIPHFYLTIDCNMDKLIEMKKQISHLFEKLTITDFLIKATASAISLIPEVNVSWINGEVFKLHNIDVALAVSIDGGLITPILRNADRKTLKQISTESKDLIEKAKNKKLLPEDYSGGSITISNLGMYRIKEFQAIINTPQPMILSIGASEKRVIVDKDNDIKIANIMTCGVSVDHRVIDGASAAIFLNHFRDMIEEPMNILL